MWMIRLENGSGGRGVQVMGTKIKQNETSPAHGTFLSPSSREIRRQVVMLQKKRQQWQQSTTINGMASEPK